MFLAALSQHSMSVLVAVTCVYPWGIPVKFELMLNNTMLPRSGKTSCSPKSCWTMLHPLFGDGWHPASSVCPGTAWCPLVRQQAKIWHQPRHWFYCGISRRSCKGSKSYFLPTSMMKRWMLVWLESREEGLVNAGRLFMVFQFQLFLWRCGSCWRKPE